MSVITNSKINFKSIDELNDYLKTNYSDRNMDYIIANIEANTSYDYSYSYDSSYIDETDSYTGYDIWYVTVPLGHFHYGQVVSRESINVRNGLEFTKGYNGTIWEPNTKYNVKQREYVHIKGDDKIKPWQNVPIASTKNNKLTIASCVFKDKDGKIIATVNSEEEFKQKIKEHYHMSYMITNIKMK